jgi:hypothetical protein
MNYRTRRNIYFMLVETFKYLVENATFKYNTCNTRVKHSRHHDSLCNIHTKRLKHSHETSGTLESNPKLGNKPEKKT